MADLPPHSASPSAGREDGGPAPSDESTVGAPRWVKAFGVIGVVLVVLVVLLLLLGGANHGPGRHAGSAHAIGQLAPASGVVSWAGHAQRKAGRAS